jgi:hypothetical protein
MLELMFITLLWTSISFALPSMYKICTNIPTDTGIDKEKYTNKHTHTHTHTLFFFFF